jgi:hypothetical protein
MIHEVLTDSELEQLRGPGLVAWLVANTERQVVVAAALNARAADLAPGVPAERVIDLCMTVRHAALETTVALLALLSQSEGEPDRSALAEAIANAHVRIQELESSAGGVPSSSIFCEASSSERTPIVSRR